MNTDSKKVKKVLVIRLGAFGDAVMVTPLLRELHKDGYEITFHISKEGHTVLRNNPYIKKFIIEQSDRKTMEEFEYDWAQMSVGFDKVINLCGTIENRLLKTRRDVGYDWDHLKRHTACNINYYEQTMTCGGYPGADCRPELHFTSAEIQDAKRFRKKYKDYFLVLWSLSGSAQHKTYPFTDYVQEAILKHPDVMIVTVGDMVCQLLEWKHPRIKNFSGIWSIRKSMLMCKYADCVVGTETGVLNASSAFDTPKVVLLSHSSVENLTKHWTNCTSLTPMGLECYPCHKLIYDRSECTLDPVLQTPMCTTTIRSREVFSAIEEIYRRWKNDHNLRAA